MPDLRTAKRFARDMEHLEADYLKAIQRAMKETRLTLVETALSDPAASLAIMARREFDALSQQIAHLASKFGGPVETAATSMIQDEFDLFNRAVSAQTVNFNQALQGTSNERQSILAGFTQGVTGWLDQLQASFLTELRRLIQTEEPAETIADRLLAEQIAATGRASVWRTGTNLAAQQSQRDLWGLATALGGIVRKAGESQAGREWRKQAIAAIDERTTDCCLRVHGQIQPLDKPFILTGTPRYADEMKAPPFHDYCRTVQALYVEEFEVQGATTDEMRDAARAELKAREDGSRKEIHPAHATSRRS